MKEWEQFRVMSAGGARPCPKHPGQLIADDYGHKIECLWCKTEKLQEQVKTLQGQRDRAIDVVMKQDVVRFNCPRPVGAGCPGYDPNLGQCIECSVEYIMEGECSE
jgi:hypothetical protein